MSAVGKAWLESFTTDEIRELRAIREHRAWLTIIVNYGLIAASMALVAYAPNALTVVLALCIIGTRQLGLAVVMHESAHYTLFKNRRLNDFVGNWLAGYPIYLSADMYRAHHLEHHTKTWTEEDPDLGLANGFPVSKASMARKVMRDLLGITGLKQLIGTTYLVVKVVRGEQVDAGTLPLRLEREPALRMVVGTVVTNVVLVAVLWSLGQPMLYLLWLGAAWPHKMSALLLVTMLITVGTLMILMGLLAELIVRTYHEAQGKPTYVLLSELRSTPEPSSDQSDKGADSVIARDSDAESS